MLFIGNGIFPHTGKADDLTLFTLVIGRTVNGANAIVCSTEADHSTYSFRVTNGPAIVLDTFVGARFPHGRLTLLIDDQVVPL